MLANYKKINRSLSEDLIQDAKTVYESHNNNHSKQFSTLSQMLNDLKIEIPQTMLKEINRCLQLFPPPQFNFLDFTHFVARATLQQQLEDQIRNLFYLVDKNKLGCVDAQDLKQFIKQLQYGQMMKEDQINEIIKELDFMSVGYLNYQDFVYLLMPK